MDLATLIGLIGAFTVVICSIVFGDSPEIFVNVPSILIVCVGSFFVVMMKFGIKDFIAAFKVGFKTLLFKMPRPDEIIAEVAELADISRKGGLLALEGREVSYDFLAKGIQLLVDGHDPTVVRTMLTKDITLSKARHQWGAKTFEAGGDVAPAMGMIGTLIGLVAMLANMDDPKTIGPAMAIAILTTLYGAVMANMIFIPMADKLKLRADEESKLQLLVMDALLAIQSGQNPRVIFSMLQAYLKTNDRTEELNS